MVVAPVTDDASGRPCKFKLPLVLCKIWWFFFGAVGVIYMGFQYPFLTTVGLSARQAGVVSAISAVVAGATSPCWGMIADKTGCRRSIVIFLCLSFMVIMFAVPWIGVKLAHPLPQCNTTTITPTHRNFTNGTTLTQLSNSTIDSGCRQGEEGASVQLFYTMLVLWLSSSCCLLPIYGLFQSITMNVVDHTRTKQGCGDQMMYSSIGGGLISLLAGLFADKFYHPSLSAYGAVYLVIPPLMLPLLPSTFVAFKYTKWEKTPLSSETPRSTEEGEEKIALNATDGKEKEEGEVEPQRKSRTEIMKTLLSNSHTAILLFTVLVIGVLMSFNNSFLFLVMKDEMAASKTSMGLTALVQCFSGTFMYFFVERIIPLFGGYVPCIEISVLSYVVRFVAISFIKDPWLVVVPMSLSGFGESLSTVAMMKYIHEISPVHVHSTMFTLMACLKFALGPCLSHIVGSWMYHMYRGPALYRGTGVMGAVWFVVLFVFFHLVPRMKKRYPSRTSSTEKC